MTKVRKTHSIIRIRCGCLCIWYSIIWRLKRYRRITLVRTHEIPCRLLIAESCTLQVFAFRKYGTQFLFCFHKRLQFTHWRVISSGFLNCFINTTQVLFILKIDLSYFFEFVLVRFFDISFLLQTPPLLYFTLLLINLILYRGGLKPFWISEMTESHGTPCFNWLWSCNLCTLSVLLSWNDSLISDASHFIDTFL